MRETCGEILATVLGDEDDVLGHRTEDFELRVEGADFDRLGYAARQGYASSEPPRPEARAE